MEHVSEIRDVTAGLPTQEFHYAAWHEVGTPGVVSDFLERMPENFYANTQKYTARILR
jgi:hypothetical protein